MGNEDRFKDFLYTYSSVYSGDQYRLLRFLLSDHLSIAQLAPDTNTGMSLFNELADRGSISYTDVKLLLEIAELTVKASAKSCTAKYISATGHQYNDSQGTRLTMYRKTLFKSLSDVTEVLNGDLHNLIVRYGLKSLNFKNKWDVVFHLEKELKLNDTQEKWERFANLLNPMAKGKLQEYQPPSTDGIASEASSEAPSSTSTVNQTAAETGGGEALPAEPPKHSTDDLQGLLVYASSWWEDRGNINQLKVLLSEFKKIGVAEIEKKNQPFDLFDLLRGPGMLSSSNVNVLLEALHLCGLQGMEDKLKEKVPSFTGFGDIEIHTFSKYRQNLLTFGIKIDNKKKTRIGNLYEIKEVTDAWALIFKLEKEGILTELKRDKFIKNLKDHGMAEEADLLK